jgi:plasmid stabilization system protein ParE
VKSYYLSLTAEQDIEDIVSYIALENSEAAFRFLDDLYELMTLLAANPLIGHKRIDLTDKPVRFWTFKRHYLIIYLDSSPIEIVRVLSGFRDVSNLLG